MSALLKFVVPAQRVLFVDVALDDAVRATLVAHVGQPDLLQFDASVVDGGAAVNAFDVAVVGNTTSALPCVLGSALVRLLGFFLSFSFFFFFFSVQLKSSTGRIESRRLGSHIAPHRQ